jgi:hypothetical protein
MKYVVQVIDAETGEVMVAQSRRLTAHYAPVRRTRQSSPRRTAQSAWRKSRNLPDLWLLVILVVTVVAVLWIANK